MIRRTLLLLAIAGICVLIKRSAERPRGQPATDRAADARWANEGAPLLRRPLNPTRSKSDCLRSRGHFDTH